MLKLLSMHTSSTVVVDIIIKLPLPFTFNIVFVDSSYSYWGILTGMKEVINI